MEAGISPHSKAEFAKIHTHWRKIANNHQQKRPFITICVAQSLDGCITVKRNERTQLSGAQSNVLTHLLRSWNDAILVGINTVEVDNPRLTVRAVRAPQPQRVLLDSKLRIPKKSVLLDDIHKKPWIFVGDTVDSDRKRLLEQCGCKIFSTKVEDGFLDLNQCMETLFSLGIRHVMVEGGAKVLTSFLNQKLVDYMVMTIAPVILRRHDSVLMHNLSSELIPYLKSVRSSKLGHDLVVFGPIDFAQLADDEERLSSNYSWDGINERETECLV